jgi:anthranilate phosphoribosyltransferase
MIIELAEKVCLGMNLSAAEMTIAMQEILSGRAETAQIARFLSGLADKGESVEEITAAAKVMRLKANKVNTRRQVVLDTCGTGGDARGSFNISTAAALVASACGINVAKHGNRSVSSNVGSADVLEALGVNINLGPTELAECLDSIGIAFLFAQNLHPAMKYAMPARQQLGRRTIFNILGPLTNPAEARHQLMGVFSDLQVVVLAEVLLGLGSTHALVVHGGDGMDEITTVDKTVVAEAKEAKVITYEISPEEFALPRARPEDLQGSDAQGNARILLDIFNGQRGPRRDIVVLNAAAAIYAAGKAESIQAGLAMAEEALDSGRTLEKLELLRKFSRQ